jgi:hypothetical protein
MSAAFELPKSFLFPKRPCVAPGLHLTREVSPLSYFKLIVGTLGKQAR